jgi:hypothetical protein
MAAESVVGSFGIRAASCPKCGVMFEAAAKRRQRCPSCSHRFELSEANPPVGVGAGGLQMPAYLAGSRARSTTGATYKNNDRVTGAAIVASGGVGLIWLGLTVGFPQVVATGAILLAFVLLGALMSSFWRRYEDLSPGQQVMVDLPRRIVWTVGRVLWGVLTVVAKILETGGGFGV